MTIKAVWCGSPEQWSARLTSSRVRQTSSSSKPKLAASQSNPMNTDTVE